MRSSFISNLFWLGVFCGLAAGKSAKKNDWYVGGIPIASYDCAGKADGNYPLPGDCTCYVACVGQTQAYKLSCGFSAAGTLLHYVASSGPDPETSTCASPAEAKCMPPAPTTPAPPAIGECLPNECKQAGNCNSYWICSDGKWEERHCGHDLFWNPNINNGFGGSCDYYGNLNDTLQGIYVDNPDCIPPCEWWQNEDEKCTGIFHFRLPYDKEHHLSSEERETILSCPTSKDGEPALVWNQALLTCDHKSAVTGC